MSHLRAPVARADRPGGARHGRPVARTAPSPPVTRIRPQLLRLAILPPVAVALSACAAVLFTVRSTGARPTPPLWAVLAGALAVALAGIAIATVAAERAATSVADRLEMLRRTSARGEADLRALVEAIRRGETPPTRTPRGKPAADGDDFELLAVELSRAHDGAAAAVLQAAQLSSQTGSEQKLEVFVNLARRLQSLVHREISILDELENEIEDPDLLKGLFHVDHLATRIRRHAENLAVLGGAVPRRQWSNPVPVTEVLRSAIAEVEQYSRVKLVPPVDGTLRGHAVADVIHLLAELVENATVFSAPHTQVLLRAGLVTSGLAIEVEDRGLGMPPAELSRMNALLADPDQVNVASLLADGRIGLFVVSQLARRHGIHVRLQTNIYGGVQAVLVVPQGLIGPAPCSAAGVTPRRPQATDPAPGPFGAPGVVGPQETAPESHRPQVPPPRGARAAYPPPDGSEHSVARGSQLSDGDPIPDEHGRTPLPVRDADSPRPNPAEAPPGIHHGDRPLVERSADRRPTPLVGTVRGTMGKPQLPRRRAQEHLAPQLSGGPTPPPRQEPDQHTGHDPGLMAAFQQGIGLAEARQQSGPDHTEADTRTGAAPAPHGDARSDAPHLDPALPGEVPAPSADAPDGDRTRMADVRVPHGPDHESTVRHDGSTPAG
ncbi:sensor histidine kinase [Streptomyces chiangmaiensis]|uniref:histidine kinase n=1 Tax=Streptomyces chiangmaiensis TaxID=766497 RepID=A0ABU7FQS6_9ACTN|nr:ATP-binding protein [Streptomyces chiangmaiensis]MED7826457.1 ATP-binding protein [Streptomyces chiangmaiensis]